jgi:hypothetical protein
MAAAEETPQVFISYASKDQAKIVALAKALEVRGVTVWRDQNQILGGENYGPKIVKAIRDAKSVVVCCSDAAMRSKNVKQEIQLAWRYDIPCLPVLLEQVAYPRASRVLADRLAVRRAVQFAFGRRGVQDRCRIAGNGNFRGGALNAR